jgi:hypothetical protein
MVWFASVRKDDEIGSHARRDAFHFGPGAMTDDFRAAFIDYPQIISRLIVHGSKLVQEGWAGCKLKHWLFQAQLPGATPKEQLAAIV